MSAPTPAKSAGVLLRWKRRAEKRWRRLSGRDRSIRRWMTQSGAFDPDWYLRANQDVREANEDPLDHYLRWGWKEGRAPAPWLDMELLNAFGLDRGDGKSGLLSLAEMKANRREKAFGRMKAYHARLAGGSSRQPGICLLGHLCSVIGLGQAARNLSYAADTQRIAFVMRDAPTSAKDRDAEFRTKCGLARDRRASIQVFDAINLAQRFEEVMPGRLDVLYPFWELPKLPESSRSLVERYDEIWAPSSFVADIFSEGCDRPVSILPQPVRIPPIERHERDGALTFLAYMDFESYAARKNPEGVVNAFLDAFPDRRDVRLRIKVRGHNDRGRRQWLEQVASRDERIEIIDGTLGRREMDRLVMDCDAYISLHRSEGFGFGPAEALAAGKPVVATNFSATTDFINADTGYPVAFRLVPVRPGEYVDWEGQVWAEPDIGDAARALREIADDYEAAKMKGARGRQLMIDRFSPEAVGRQMRGMLLERGLIDGGAEDVVPAAGFEPATP